jgi:hypothetical protein
VVDAGAPVDVALTAPEPGPWASAWTDPSAVARLAADCNFHPPASDDPSEGDPLECSSNIEEQSCSYDPCHEGVDLPCRRVCGRTCTRCDTRCRSACGRCRAACHDDACVRACATSCGACLQSCIATKDQCVTAGCSARYRACWDRSVGRFRRGPCLAACTRCTTRCGGQEVASRCVARCVGRACTAEDVNHCTWDGPSYGLDTDAPPEGSAPDAAAP